MKSNHTATVVGKLSPELRVEYAESSYVPKFASLSNGEPYSGRAYGSFGIADWIGTFVNGLPDGQFDLVLGDRSRGTAFFKNGVVVK